MRRTNREAHAAARTLVETPLGEGIPAALTLLAIGAPSLAHAREIDPAEVSIGERLFLEIRLVEFFARHASDANAELAAGDPVLETSATWLRISRTSASTTSAWHGSNTLPCPARIALCQTTLLAARLGQLRNPILDLAGVAIGTRDIEVLAAFLHALNEDCE